MSDMLLTRREVKAALAKERLAERARSGWINASVLGGLTLVYLLFVWPLAFADYMQSLPGDVIDLLQVVGLPATAVVTIIWLLQPMVRNRR